MSFNDEINQKLRTLQQNHKQLEKKLSKLNKHKTLTPREELEKKELQKEKLRTKDQMESLLRQTQSSGLNETWLGAKLKRT
jgi:hypothetical protein